MKKGSYSLHWMNTDKASWGKRAKPSSRGLTYTDINHVPGYGVIPQTATWLNFAAARIGARRVRIRDADRR